MKLGTYRLISRLGAGGMGEVWRAEDTKLLRHVAIKILPTAMAQDPEWKERFVREARTIAQLNHPNIATIYSIEEDNDPMFIAMELVEGDSLGAIIARGPLAPSEAIRIASQTADALSEAHAKGIVHRDIKPDNILVARRLVKVLDFGIAKQIGGADKAALTQGGMIIGTPHYMSPEQALGRAVDARTDIFALGVVLYEALSGHRPFTGASVTETIMQIVMNDPEDILTAAPRTPRGLAEIVRKCLKKQPDERFESADDLIAALASLKKSSGIQRKEDLPTIPTVRPQTEAEAPPTQKQKAFVPPPTAKIPAAPAPTPAPAPPKPVPAQPPLPGRRALVADDDPATRYLIGSVLAHNRIAYDEVDNGADAVKHLKQNEYTHVFVDLLMPRVDGWGVIDFVRTHRRGGKPLHLYVVTGVQNQKLSTADQDVVSGLLYKPLDPKQVEKLVKG
jgi:eukaryotic-like serine/threonine-protein kinase